MSWISVPNEVVRTFTGTPMKAQALDKDLEAIFKPMPCPSKGCEQIFINVSAFGEHIMGEHGLPASTTVEGQPLLEEATTARLIMGLLLLFNREGRDNPLALIRKSNDSFHAGETWRRAYLALTRKETEIRLKKDQYDWLHQLLDRKFPLSKEVKDMGAEQQTVGMALYGLSEDSVRQAYTTLPERRKIEAEDAVLVEAK